MEPAAVMRSLASYLPNSSMLRIRSMRDSLKRIRRLPHEADFKAFSSYVKCSPSIVDAGANRGQAIESFRNVLRHPVIDAFEPNPILAEYLRQRYRSGPVTIHEAGLGSEDGQMVLYLPRYGETVWDTRASLDREMAALALKSTDFWPFKAERLFIDEVVVSMSTLDSFRLEPDIIKIDVEGTEEAVMQGSLETIEAHRPIILVEGRVAPLMTRLGPAGYMPHRFDANVRSFLKGEPGELNTFMLCEAHYDLFELSVV